MKKYTNYKQTGIEWIGDIPEHWDLIALKRTGYIANGNGFPNELQGLSDGKYYFFKTSDINGVEVLAIKAENMVGEELVKEKKWKVIKKGSIVFSKIGAAALMNHRKILAEDSLIDNNLSAFIPSSSHYSRFFYYLMKNIDMNWFIQPGAVPSVSISKLSSQKIALPLPEEQKMISSFLTHKLTAIDNLISKNNQLIQLLEEKKQATINQAVTKGLDPNVKMKDSGIEWIGEIPEHWELTKIKFIGEISIGIIYSPEDIVEYNEGGTLVLRSSNIQDGKLDLEDNVYVNKEINEKYLLKTGDILICSRNGSKALIGKNILIDERVSGQTFGAFMTVLRTKYHAFVYYFVNSQLFTSQSELFSTTTINQLTVGTLSNLYIALPDKEEQEKISKYLADFNLKINKTIDKIKSQNFLLEEYRQALISNAVTGKIDVRDVPIPEKFIKDQTL